MSIECERMDEELRKDALDVIETVWHGLNWENIGSRRRMRIYDEFVAKIRSAAHTGRFSQFYGNLCRKIGSAPPDEWAAQAREAIQRIEERKLDLDILELIIDEDQYLILLLREKNDMYKSKATRQRNKRLGV